MAVQITAALAVKDLMEREGLPGTIQIWPGVAEELVATKAYYVRAGMFEDVDIVLYAHVGNNLSTGWGMTPGTGLISAMFTFEGFAAHAGGAPWSPATTADQKPRVHALGYQSSPIGVLRGELGTDP